MAEKKREAVNETMIGKSALDRLIRAQRPPETLLFPPCLQKIPKEPGCLHSPAFSFIFFTLNNSFLIFCNFSLTFYTGSAIFERLDFT